VHVGLLVAIGYPRASYLRYRALGGAGGSLWIAVQVWALAYFILLCLLRSVLLWVSGTIPAATCWHSVVSLGIPACLCRPAVGSLAEVLQTAPVVSSR